MFDKMHMQKPNSKEKFRDSVKVKKSKAGLGLFATKKIPKNSFIIEYFGQILSNKERDEKGGRYLFETSANRTIDGSCRENTARYVNHSCKPNCEIEIIRGRVYIVSKRTILPGEEITYDYGEEYFDEFIKPNGCKCESCLKD